jgi:multiple sugar transport system permease protein
MTARRVRRSGWGYTLVGALIVLAYLFPVYWMVITSLKPPQQIFATPPLLVPAPPVLTSYQQAVFDDDRITRAVGNSTIVSVSTMLLTLLLATPAAYALARFKLRGAGLVILILLITQMLPSIALASPLYVAFSRIGLVNSLPALVIACTTGTLPFAVIVLRPFFLSIPRDLEQAAQIDGCTKLGAFLRVIVPLLQPGLITVGAFSFLFTWGEFPFGLALTTNEAVRPITVAMNNMIGQYGTKWNDLMAVATVIALPVILVFALLQRYIISGLVSGATKE